jgi:hypothetical protein
MKPGAATHDQSVEQRTLITSTSNKNEQLTVILPTAQSLKLLSPSTRKESIIPDDEEQKKATQEFFKFTNYPTLVI